LTFKRKRDLIRHIFSYIMMVAQRGISSLSTRSSHIFPLWQFICQDIPLYIHTLMLCFHDLWGLHRHNDFDTVQTVGYIISPNPNPTLKPTYSMNCDL